MGRLHIRSVALGAIGLSIIVGLPACDRSAGDATAENAPPVTGIDRLLGSFDIVRARVRNESTARADVTLRFIREATVVHLAFVRVPPDTVTTVGSPEAVDLVELSGVSDAGWALESETFVFGLDFDEAAPAEYVVRDAADLPAPEPNPGSPAPTSVSLLEPGSDATLPLGATLQVRWEDASGTPGAVVSVLLRPVGSAGADDWIPVSPAVGAALDGTNDQIVIVLQGLDPGTYEIVARIEDGEVIETALAGGLVEVVRDPFNEAPHLSILSPAAALQLRIDDLIAVRWSDTDPDDNATITFTLESANRVAGPPATFTISPPIAEDPDGDSADATTIVVGGVHPGLYDLVGTIDDGRLIGTARVPGAVLILPEPDNDPPQLTFIEPAVDVEVSVGDAVLVRWADADENDDARISLLLDPYTGSAGLTGDEILLVTSLGEDEDGNGDRVTLGIPSGVSPGAYRFAGVISDGLTQVVTAAPGIVYVEGSSAVPVGGSGDSGDNGGGVGVGEGGGGSGGGGGGPGGGGGGSGGGGGGPDPDDSSSTVTVTILGSAEDVRVGHGETVEVLVEASTPEEIERRRFFLSNLPYGGELRVEVTPVEVPEADRFITAIRTDAVPNDAWPRKFDLEIETEVDGRLDLFVAPRPVWIRQEVEIADLELVGEPCGADGMVSYLNEPFLRLDVTWYGGGFEETDTTGQVQFWLTSDGTVPDDEVGDGRHQLVLRRSPSPNEYQIFGVALEPVTSEVLNAQRARYPTVPRTVAASVEPGWYYVVTVLHPDGSDRTVSVPYPDQVEYCDRKR